MNVYKGLSIEDIEAQYFLRGLRPQYESKDLPGWLERSKRFVESTDARLDLVYGPRERNRLDLFPVRGAADGTLHQVPRAVLGGPATTVQRIHSSSRVRGSRGLVMFRWLSDACFARASAD